MPIKGALADFFSQYSASGFRYNPRNAATSEFYRLCDHSGWRRDDDERELAHSKFRDALTQQFNTNYGTDSEDLAAWQNLCILLCIQPVPDSLKHCRQVVVNTHVNLIDLVDVDNFENPSRRITTFDTVKALSEYTISTGKYFPRENIHAGDLLKYLLRQILNPPSERQRHNRGGERRKGGPSGRRQRVGV